MILKTFKDYLIELDKSDINILNQEVVEKGVEGYLSLLLVYLDCSRIINNMRMMQTIGYPYRRTITETIFTIKNYVEENKQDEYFERLLKRHSDNLEYEQTNPPIWYGTEKDRRKYEKQYGGNNSSKPKRKRTKQQDVDFPDIPKKQTAAEKKLAARVAKINALSFKIKPKN